MSKNEKGGEFSGLFGGDRPKRKAPDRSPMDEERVVAAVREANERLDRLKSIADDDEDHTDDLYALALTMFQDAPGLAAHAMDQLEKATRRICLDPDSDASSFGMTNQVFGALAILSFRGISHQVRFCQEVHDNNERFREAAKSGRDPDPTIISEEFVDSMKNFLDLFSSYIRHLEGAIERHPTYAHNAINPLVVCMMYGVQEAISRLPDCIQPERSV